MSLLSTIFVICSNPKWATNLFAPLTAVFRSLFSLGVLVSFGCLICFVAINKQHNPKQDSHTTHCLIARLYRVCPPKCKKPTNKSQPSTCHVFHAFSLFFWLYIVFRCCFRVVFHRNYPPYRFFRNRLKIISKRLNSLHLKPFLGCPPAAQFYPGLYRLPACISAWCSDCYAPKAFGYNGCPPRSPKDAWQNYGAACAA